MKKKLKVLNADLTSPFQDFKYELGKVYHCKDFDSNPDNTCSRGHYGTDVEGLPYSFNINRKIFECEMWGKEVIIDQYKQRFEYQKITRECTVEEIQQLAKAEEPRLGYTLSEVLFPVNPFRIRNELTEKDIELLKVWASVRDSVWDFVGYSVRYSVRDSVWASVWETVWETVWASVRDSVGASVRDSVWDFVGAYTSSLFPNIEKWAHTDRVHGTNPFRSGIDLWKRGFVPSFDGSIWRIHAGKEAKVVYEEKK